MDFAARRAKANDDAKPLRKEANEKDLAAQALKTKLAELKKAQPRDDVAINATQSEIDVLTKRVRELSAKAQEIEDAIYDLKAVNPNKKTVMDDRTPEQLLEVIAAKGVEISQMLGQLRIQS